MPSAPARSVQLAFAPGVAEQIGFYVYLLIDPRDDAVFYVGKGTSDRCFDHISTARKTRGNDAGNYAKLGRIREIEATGASVRIELLRHGLSEREAFLVESAAIDLLRLRGLLNRVVGHDAVEFGRMSVGDVNALYGARPVTIDPRHRVVLIRINQLFERGMSDDALYEATRKWWRIAPARRHLGAASAPEWAMAVYAGIVRAVYRIETWEKPTEKALAEEPNDAGRWGFHGSHDPVMETLYRDRDVSSYLRAVDTERPSQNPLRYVNCR
ncbi:MAG: hypothetical protein M3Q10_15030 [Chloroflexota bacterium]|nr:hypothetical protein [Chloroflexota bacterium]